MSFQQPEAGQYRPPLTGIAGELATTITDTIKHAAATAPRSLQIAPGPSELGTPCTRRLGYKVLDWDPKPNSDTDPWAAIIGTSVHTWMAETWSQANLNLNYERYLIEHKVDLPEGISGSCDLYDRLTGTVIDWKVTSPANITKYRKNGPGEQYRTQAHLYALGMQLAAGQPAHVAIVFLPRGGRIDGMHIWTEPYDPHIAVKAIRRYDAMRQFHYTVDPERHPERWALLPTRDAHCTWCPWFLPGSADLSQGCPGHQPATAPSKEK